MNTWTRCSALLLLVAAAGWVQADPYNVLDGIQRGQSLAQVKSKLGEPFHTDKFKDGWIALAFHGTGHYLVLETNPDAPDSIANIQITGDANPPLHGLGKLDLGEDVSSAVEAMGKPDRVEQATDAVDKKPVAATSIYQYDGFSFETSGGKVTSIKLDGPNHPLVDEVPNVSRFLATLRGGDAYAVSQWLSPALEIDGRAAIDGPMLEAVQGDTGLHETLFGKNGLSSLDSAKGEGALRIFDAKADGTRNPSGYVFKPKNGSVHELVFVEGEDGSWQLYEVN